MLGDSIPIRQFGHPPFVAGSVTRRASLIARALDPPFIFGVPALSLDVDKVRQIISLAKSRQCVRGMICIVLGMSDALILPLINVHFLNI